MQLPECFAKYTLYSQAMAALRKEKMVELALYKKFKLLREKYLLECEAWIKKGI